MKTATTAKAASRFTVTPQRRLAVAKTAAQRARIAEAWAKDSAAVLQRITLRELIRATKSETEKNLARVLAQAERNQAVLFFDEADALFGKRTTVQDSHDRYANAETNFLLEKMESSQAHIIIGVSPATEASTNPDHLQRWRETCAVKIPPRR